LSCEPLQNITIRPLQQVNTSQQLLMLVMNCQSSQIANYQLMACCYYLYLTANLLLDLFLD